MPNDTEGTDGLPPFPQADVGMVQVCMTDDEFERYKSWLDDGGRYTYRIPYLSADDLPTYAIAPKRRT